VNKRIQELAIQSGAATSLFNAQGQYYVVKPEIEKFAELIIRECLKLMVTGEGNVNTANAIWDLEELGVDVSKLLDQILELKDERTN
jgi:hypothetical protein